MRSPALAVFDAFVRRINNLDGRTIASAAPEPPPPAFLEELTLDSGDYELVDQNSLTGEEISEFTDGTGLIHVDVSAVEHVEISARETERTLSELSSMLRYGQRAEVVHRLQALLESYRDDPLLHRQVAEFWNEEGQTALAIDALFRLASILFSRGRVDALGQIVTQILTLQPDNPQGHRLKSLLDTRQ